MNYFYGLWSTATNMRQINSWFSWASFIREVRQYVFSDHKTPDHKVDPSEELGKGKEFLVGYRLPLIGDYVFSAKVTQFLMGK